MRRRTKLFVFLLMGLLVGTIPSFAQWRSDIGVFRIGVVTGGQASGFTNRADPFRLALEQSLGMDVEFFTATRAETIVDALASDRIEYAILSATGYALASAVCECIEPLVSPRSADGTDGYNLILITRSDGPDNLNALAGQKIGLLSSEEALETGILKLALQNAGLALQDINFGKKTSGEATLEAFIAGEYQALLGWSSLTGDPSTGYTRGTLQMIARSTGNLTSNYPIIWKSEQVGHRVHGIRKKLPAAPKNILRKQLVSLYNKNPVVYDAIEPIYGGGFSVSRHSKYQPFIDVIKTLQPAPEAAIEIEPEAGKEDAAESENPSQ